MSAAIRHHPPAPPADDPRLAVTAALAERVVALRQAMHQISYEKDILVARDIASCAVLADSAAADRGPTPAEETR